MTTTIRTTTRPTPRLSELPTDLLEGFRARAGELDRTNAYFHDDLAELQELGYLTAAVPTALGGWGYSLAELARSQQRLAGTHPRRRWRRRCTSTGRASRPSSSVLATTRCAGSRSGSSPATSSPRATRRPATTSRCSCRPAKPSASRAGTASPVASSSARTGRCGPGSGRTRWTWPRRAARRSSMPSSSARAPASPSWRRGTPSACGRARATTRSSTASSCPTSGSAASPPRATTPTCSSSG